MELLLLSLFFITICNSKPITNEEIFANDKILTNIIKPKGYYPDFKQYGREQAVLEHEHWISKIDSMYNRAQKKAADFLNLKPIVDTIEEHEKYGNDGEQHRGIAKALVHGFDGLGKKVNDVVDLPFKARDYVGKTINAALDAVGSKLVGI
ncbi:uncharacterized protein [Onthophagus taurus]|uniref:uncharacterized protein n=1 Tax=Onthophagus taurus TaxID=166361 RepID=UPI000C20ADB9|nr:uncharacterized protein LOC111425052 [Onthophagus taurus]